MANDAESGLLSHLINTEKASLCLGYIILRVFCDHADCRKSIGVYTLPPCYCKQMLCYKNHLGHPEIANDMDISDLGNF